MAERSGAPGGPVPRRLDGGRDRPTVALGILGPTLDRGRGPKRWGRWRPTVGLVAQPDLIVDRLELVVQPAFRTLADQVIADIRALSPETEVREHSVAFADPWDFEAVYGALAELAETLDWNPDTADHLVHITTGSHVAQICLFLLTETRMLPGRLVQTHPGGRDRGAHGGHTIIDLDLSRYDRIAQRFDQARREATGILKDGIETRNAAFNALMDEIEQVALGSRAPVLLTGPTGAGKTRLARRIYELKRARRQVRGAFVELNCATLRGDGAMSALFGHVRGAFTGAGRDRPGLLRRGDQGVVFLDEIGELGLDEQAMLLRALEERRFLPVGADDEVESDFQLIAGTNRDLHAEVRAGRFREDLLARIDTWTFRLPGLRERREDIPPNLDHELQRHARELGRRITFSREARARFLAFALGPEGRWSRNFRDLGAAVTRMATLAAGGRITEAVVAREEARLRRAWDAGRAGDPDEALLRAVMGEAVDELDRFDLVQLAEVVRVCQRSPSLAAAGRTLFARSRLRRASRNDSDRVRKVLARHGLDFDALQG